MTVPRLPAVVALLGLLGGSASSQEPARGQEPVRGQEPAGNELELFELDREVKVGIAATKTDRPADEAPAIVEVVTRREIREWGYSSVAEVLAHIVGFYIIDDHILPNVALRGVSGGLFAESSVIKVMI